MESPSGNIETTEVADYQSPNPGPLLAYRKRCYKLKCNRFATSRPCPVITSFESTVKSFTRTRKISPVIKALDLKEQPQSGCITELSDDEM